MEASALTAPAGLTRLSLGGPLLRLRSDEQLIAAFRAGSEEAFTTLVSRYEQRLFAYTRQMMGGSRQDAEDALQDVFVRAYGALRTDEREVNVRAWLYRVAHNRCVDQLRRPTPPDCDVFAMSRKPLHDPVEQAQRREDLRTLVDDVGRLPEQQRSALLMREIDGMSYADLAEALGTSVPAVKSLLVRARVGLAEAIEARELDCSVIRVDLTEAYDRGVKASGRARRHMRECEGCREYRSRLRTLRRSFAALTPLGAGPLALAAKILGIGGASGGAAASAGAGGGTAVGVGMGVGGAAACKVAAVVCTAALATGGAVEVSKMSDGSSRSAPVAHIGGTARDDVSARPQATVGATTPYTPRAAALPSTQQRHRSQAAAAPGGESTSRNRADRRRATALTRSRPAIDDPTVPSAGLPAAVAPVMPEQAVNIDGTPAAPVEETTGGAMAPLEAESVVAPSGAPAPTPAGTDRPAPEAPATVPSAPSSSPATTRSIGGTDGPGPGAQTGSSAVSTQPPAVR